MLAPKPQAQALPPVQGVGDRRQDRQVLKAGPGQFTGSQKSGNPTRYHRNLNPALWNSRVSGLGKTNASLSARVISGSQHQGTGDELLAPVVIVVKEMSVIRGEKRTGVRLL
ncbi:hypothetical protein RRG08_001078 [Elysia crispata]|uniref:Uncharacterized protein n=1 Tax=Elysia crispata TaxID=231223 RepID=A0AAE1AX25_9GAST|nr:hypothetical protein RRG08_001078 [Elysia crispata]